MRETQRCSLNALCCALVRPALKLFTADVLGIGGLKALASVLPSGAELWPMGGITPHSMAGCGGYRFWDWQPVVCAGGRCRNGAGEGDGICGGMGTI